MESMCATWHFCACAEDFCAVLYTCDLSNIVCRFENKVNGILFTIYHKLPTKHNLLLLIHTLSQKKTISDDLHSSVSGIL